MTPWDRLTKYFPKAEAILSVENFSEQMGEMGIIRSRSNTISELASLYGRYKKWRLSDTAAFKAELLKIKGIGKWTAEYLSMRGLSWPDAFPVTDLGVKLALMDLLEDESGQSIASLEGVSSYVRNKKYEKAALEYAEDYQPWRSYLTLHLWKSLGEKGVKDE